MARLCEMAIRNIRAFVVKLGAFLIGVGWTPADSVHPKGRASKSVRNGRLSNQKTTGSSSGEVKTQLQPSASPAIMPAQLSISAETRPFRGFYKGAMMETSAAALGHATALYNFAVFALIVGSIIVLLATVGLIWAGSLKSRDADGQLAQALVQIEQAKADAAHAQEKAAEFLSRAQEARLEQEKTSLELARVRKLTAGRRLTEAQHDKIAKALQGHPIALVLLSASNDPEAAQFANDLVKALRDGGASVTASTSVMSIPMRGLGMSMTNSEVGAVLYATLKGAGLQIKDLPERNPILIVVGSRAPTLAE